MDRDKAGRWSPQQEEKMEVGGVVTCPIWRAERTGQAGLWENTAALMVAGERPG